MSLVNRPALDRQAFIDMVDGFCLDIGLPAYSEIARALPHHAAAHEMAERKAADLYAGLRETAGHIAVAQRDLMKTGRAQDPEALDRLIEEIVERVSAAYGAAGIALYSAEMRVDLDDRADVIVLAEARTRLRAAGRRL